MSRRPSCFSADDTLMRRMVRMMRKTRSKMPTELRDGRGDNGVALRSRTGEDRRAARWNKAYLKSAMVDTMHPKARKKSKQFQARWKY